MGLTAGNLIKVEFIDSSPRCARVMISHPGSGNALGAVGDSFLVPGGMWETAFVNVVPGTFIVDIDIYLVSVRSVIGGIVPDLVTVYGGMSKLNKTAPVGLG